ncbi:Glucans biosynthesis glucosyltransferase H [Rubripirellula amarantea]|uniref:Glucans biosynthesis glucosyltransferase H n=1 Tax=Rubripirellula amarantea TaxID=2527999 RepID=A0A5C5WBB8_9BACT|nr:glucans biosynthesis glucosyltransferase MdoH [Rubripirellula amarantea]TWT48158.1 Glucans biosynthesis glucosyltransferase H [Rubripirellula amarantea]
MSETTAVTRDSLQTNFQPAKVRQRTVQLAVVTLTLISTAIATWYFIEALQGRGLHLLELAAIPLFALLFGWITFSLCLATLGFVDLLKRPAKSTEATEHATQGRGDDSGEGSRTAVLMPVYNESPRRVFAGVRAMMDCLDRMGVGHQFDFFVLSDTTNSEIWLAEEIEWSRCSPKQQTPKQQTPNEQTPNEQTPNDQTLNGSRIFYRHRPNNEARKSGNIADFCKRWGSQYPFMIVLDADSLMSADTMIEMVTRMRSDPKLGILQVPPVPIGRLSLFARLQQFAASAYGNLFVRGFAKWAGSEGNYWGHNAIIRVQPFMDHCELPKLPGRAPLGGEILSHDFVEAALMLRAGYKVDIASDLGGSFEECPTTLTDYAKRDQRWCQGNLQHSRLIVNESINPLSRFHFTSGILAYAASPLWLLMTGLCIVALLWEGWSSTGEASTGEGGIVLSERATHIALVLFVTSMTMLLLPKVMSLVTISLDSQRRRLFGGTLKLWFSGMIEMLTSILLSPIMAIYHTQFVVSTLAGTNVRWSAQQRDERGVRWIEAIVDFAGMMVLGAAITTFLYYLQPTLLLWFSPFLVGLVLAVPIAVAMGSGSVGGMLARAGLLAIPEDFVQPEVVKAQHSILRDEPVSEFAGFSSLLDAVIRSPKLYLLHRNIQAENGCDVPLPTSQSKAIEAAFAASGTKGIPDKLVGPLLKDAATLETLHIEAQLAGAR